MTTESYLTIQEPSEGIYKEKGSKFIAYAFPASSVEEFKEQLELIKKDHFAASHHCFAYRLGIEGVQFRANDDGEPGHTAGDPILNQIRSANLTNVGIVVVRYFGGTKLGKSGLINAYRTASAEALSSAIVIQKKITTGFEILCSYEKLSDVLRIINAYSIRVLGQEYLQSCRIHFESSQADAERIKAALMENPSICQFKLLPGRS